MAKEKSNNTAFKIEKGIKLPLRTTSKKYPFRLMEVGDSFLFGNYSIKEMTRAVNAANSWKKRSGLDWKFAVRKIDNEMRVWRIK